MQSHSPAGWRVTSLSINLFSTKAGGEGSAGDLWDLRCVFTLNFCSVWGVYEGILNSRMARNGGSLGEDGILRSPPGNWCCCWSVLHGGLMPLFCRWGLSRVDKRYLAWGPMGQCWPSPVDDWTVGFVVNWTPPWRKKFSPSRQKSWRLSAFTSHWMQTFVPCPPLSLDQTTFLFIDLNRLP